MRALVSIFKIQNYYLIYIMIFSYRRPEDQVIVEFMGNFISYGPYDMVNTIYRISYSKALISSVTFNVIKDFKD